MTNRPPITHDLKTWPEYFRAVDNGSKTFECRKDDRDYQVGDTLTLREYDPDNGYTGAATDRVVTDVLRDFEGVERDFVLWG